MAFKNVLTTALLGASAVNAHLIMTNPVPYGKDSLNNSPLAADGSDFPCKQRSGVYDVGKENTYSVGDSIPLSFQGSATHGGGSCQVSLTTDREPTKDSNWMVIKSIEGGCPLNTEGNISGGETNKVPGNLNFTIPDGISSGKYTMAWTWFNRVGNREMYMNCAPVTVQGGSSKRSDEEAQTETEAESESALEKRDGEFPGMFVANVNGCTTPESKDLRFPNPGEDVEYNGDPSNLMSEGQKSCSGTPEFGGGSGGSGGGGASVSASIGVNIGGGGGAAATQSASSGGGFAAQSGSSSSAPAPTQPAASSSGSSSSGSGSSGSSSNSAPSSGSSSSSSGSSSGSSSSSGSAKSGSCSQNGAWNCIDGSTYQRCASGKWTEAQQMAAGTECSPGEDTQNLSIKATLNARMSSEMRHRKRSLHHGAHHA